MSKIDWSKTPDAQFFVNGSFYKYDHGKWFWSSSDGIWAKTPYESPENFSWWGFRVEAPVAWNGEGLPPVGVICERRTHAEAQGGRYEQVKILAHTSRGFPVWENIDGMFAGISKTQRMGDYPEFRQIRTPEQIAADERLHKLRNAHIAIAKTLDDFKGDIPAESVSRQTIEAMIDAGYVKP